MRGDVAALNELFNRAPAVKAGAVVQEQLRQAKRLLRYSDKSFTSIATYLGFSSSSHFSKVFKEKTDLTPFDYRLLHKHY